MKGHNGNIDGLLYNFSALSADFPSFEGTSCPWAATRNALGRDPDG